MTGPRPLRDVGAAAPATEAVEGPTTDDVAVTVVITAHDQAGLIADAVASALAQTHPRTEVVVVDDGSTDGTPEVVAGFAGVVLLRRTQGGVCAARNDGAARATGGFLCFLDGDDVLHPDAVRTGLRHLRAAGADFSVGRARLVGADGGPLPTRVHPVVAPDQLYRRLLAQSWVVPPAVVLVSRAALEAVGPWDEGLSHGGDDLDLYLRLARTARGVDHTDVVCDYRLHGTNRSSSYEACLRDNLRVLAAQQAHTRDDPALEAARRRGERSYRRVFGTKAALAGLQGALRRREGVAGAALPAVRASARHPVLVGRLLLSQVARRGRR